MATGCSDEVHRVTPHCERISESERSQDALVEIKAISGELMSRSRCVLLAAIGLVVLAVAAALLVRRTRDFLVNLKTRVELLAELQPVVLQNCTLKRFGSANDGGYLLCDNLSEGIQSAYSYGIGQNDDLGCDVSTRYGVPIHQYDCFDPARPKCEDGIFVFHNECIGPQSGRHEGGRVFDTLPNQIAKNLDTGKRLIVKMDVEGAEWDSLLATPDTVLDQIDQMPMELHGVNERRFLKVVRRLKQKFYVVNLHFNNSSCTGASWPLPAWAYQVLWVNKRLGILDESAPTPAPMSALNAPDAPNIPDCQLPPSS
jgi:hypothetical protein